MGPLGFPLSAPAASTMANRVDALFYVISGISFAIFFGVCLALFYFCFKYRRGSPADRSNFPRHNTILEATWITIPVLLAIGTFVWAAHDYVAIYAAPAGAMNITVVGKQWMWKIQHPEGNREINELHIPVGRPVKLNMISQDVIHDFFVPAFRVKQDVLPDRWTTIWFQVTKPGRYHLFCSQYCGMDHANMGGWVIAMPPADYQKWLTQGQTAPSAVEAGSKLFLQLGCAGCHTPGSSVRAPMLDGIYGKPVPLKGGAVVTVDDRYLHDSIMLPKSQVVEGYKPIMPDYGKVVTGDQVFQLVQFIKSLGPKQEQTIR